MPDLLCTVGGCQLSGLAHRADIGVLAGVKTSTSRQSLIEV